MMILAIRVAADADIVVVVDAGVDADADIVDDAVCADFFCMRHM